MHIEYWEKHRNARSMKQRPTFQVGDRLFKTLHAAAKFEAWRLILDKYLSALEMAGGNVKLSNVRSARGLVCTCNLGYIGEDQPDYNDCPLHDRKTGYFARLHVRLCRNIERQYSLAADRTAASNIEAKMSENNLDRVGITGYAPDIGGRYLGYSWKCKCGEWDSDYPYRFLAVNAYREHKKNCKVHHPRVADCNLFGAHYRRNS